VSKSARLTIVDEIGLAWRDAHWREDLAVLLNRDTTDVDVVLWAPTDFAAGPSSGSYPAKGMVVVPASTASVAGIAMGLSKDLLQRAADVALKERRPLVVCVRETPFTRSTLEHMLTLDTAGAVVLPCNPAFYHGPTQMQQLVDFVAGKVLDAVGVPNDLFTRWQGELGAARKAAPSDEPR
jgi:4-hydroxy-3-polyprenylbenzoate decarboxylase